MNEYNLKELLTAEKERLIDFYNREIRPTSFNTIEELHEEGRNLSPIENKLIKKIKNDY